MTQLRNSIIYLCSYRSKSYTSVIISDSEVTFLEKEEDAAFCQSLLYFVYIRRCKIEEVSHQISLSSILLEVFHRGQQISCIQFVIISSSSSSANCDNTPGRPTPDYLKVVKQNYSWPEIHLVFSDQGYHTLLYRYAKHNREGGRKRTNEQTRTWSAPSAKKEVCDTVHSLCICRLSRACILRETSTKPLTMLTSSRID